MARKNDKYHPNNYSLNAERPMNISKDRIDDKKKYRSLSQKEQILVSGNHRVNTRDVPKDLIYNGSNVQPPVPLGSSDD